MTKLFPRLMGDPGRDAAADPANDDTAPGRASLDTLSDELIEARNRKVHCQAALAAAEMRYEAAEQAFFEECSSRGLPWPKSQSNT